MASWRQWVVLVLMLCATLTGAHHAGQDGAAAEHELIDSMLEAVNERDVSTVLENAKSIDKSTINPSDDKVALLANFRNVHLRTVNAAHASRSGEHEETEKDEQEHKPAVDSTNDMEVEDPDDVRGRRLHKTRRMLLLH